MLVTELKVREYKYNDDIYIQARANSKYCIYCYISEVVLGKDLIWHNNPFTSNLTDEFIANSYFDSAQQALDFLETNKGKY